ncbi:MAG: hypothetical protein ABI656_00525 [bacterium]
MRSINHAAKVILALAICSSGLAASAEPPAIVNGMGPALATDQLEKYRGGTDTVINDMTLSGTVAHNSATDVVTGTNIINGAAFANSNGLATVIQNTGANVLIQSATIVNVEFK